MLGGDVSDEEKDKKTEKEQLTGVASSSRRRLSAEQDSRIGWTRSNETLSPRLTIPENEDQTDRKFSSRQYSPSTWTAVTA
jgi:hypothetical protein